MQMYAVKAILFLSFLAFKPNPVDGLNGENIDGELERLGKRTAKSMIEENIIIKSLRTMPEKRSFGNLRKEKMKNKKGKSNKGIVQQYKKGHLKLI